MPLETLDEAVDIVLAMMDMLKKRNQFHWQAVAKRLDRCSTDY